MCMCVCDIVPRYIVASYLFSPGKHLSYHAGSSILISTQFVAEIRLILIGWMHDLTKSLPLIGILMGPRSYRLGIT